MTATEEENIPGITEVVEDEEEDKNKEEEEQTFWGMLTAKVNSIPPVRLVLIVLAAYFVIKNVYISATQSPAPAADLPPDHEERMAEQRIKNWERVMETVKTTAILLIPYLLLRYVNGRAEKKERLEREKMEAEERALNKELEQAKQRKKDAEKVVERKRIEEIMLGGLKKEEEEKEKESEVKESEVLREEQEEEVPLKRKEGEGKKKKKVVRD